MRRLDATFDNTSGKPSETAKYKVDNLAEHLHRSAPELCRVVASMEAKRETSEVQPLIRDLADAVSSWRSGL